MWLEDTLEASHWPQDSDKDGSAVLNGGFEDDVANGGFDWREVPVSGADFNFDRAIAHSGSRSLRIDFDGTENPDFQHLFQYVSVEPGTHYHFSAYLRTQEISTDRGICFEIVDYQHRAQPTVASSELTGTNPWTLVQADFDTGPDTRLIRVAVRRVPSWKFDNKLRGTVWVDDVDLTPTLTQVKD